MEDMWILTIVLSAEMFVFTLVLLYMSWKSGIERRERELKHFIAQSLAEWPVERALNDWLKTAISEWPAKYTLQDWLKAEVASWPVKDVLREQISEIVESEVRRQLLDAKLKAA